MENIGECTGKGARNVVLYEYSIIDTEEAIWHI